MVWVRYNETLANNSEGCTADIPASTAAWLAQRGFITYCEPVSAEPTEDLTGQAALDTPEKPVAAPKGPGRGNYPRKPRQPRKAV